MTTPELIQQLLVPILVAVGGLIVVIIGTVVATFRRQDKIMDAMADREKARIEADASRTIATVEREKIFNGLITGVQDDNRETRADLQRLQAQYDKLDTDYRKLVEYANQLQDTILELHKQGVELPFLREKVDILEKQIDGIQESRAARELDLKAANERADASEAKLEAATIEWATERDSLNARIVELEAKVRQLEMVEPRVTHIEAQLGTDEHPVVPPGNGEAAA